MYIYIYIWCFLSLCIYYFGPFMFLVLFLSVCKLMGTMSASIGTGSVSEHGASSRLNIDQAGTPCASTESCPRRRHGTSRTVFTLEYVRSLRHSKALCRETAACCCAVGATYENSQRHNQIPDTTNVTNNIATSAHNQYSEERIYTPPPPRGGGV